MSENDNVQKMQQMYAAFGRGDIATILANVSDDVDWGTDTTADVPWYHIRHGKNGVAEFFATLDREVEFTNFVPGGFAGTGDRVYVLVDIGYRMKKSGRAASTGSVHVFTMRDEIVTRFRAFEDTASVRDAWNG